MEHSFCIIVLITAVIVAVLCSVQLVVERRYHWYVARLRRDPTDPELYERTLAAGRLYACLVCHAAFDEVALTTALHTARTARLSEDASIEQRQKLLDEL